MRVEYFDRVVDALEYHAVGSGDAGVRGFHAELIAVIGIPLVQVAQALKPGLRDGRVNRKADEGVGCFVKM